MQELSYEVTVNEPGEAPLSRGQVWQGLLMKAEDARPFVEGMERCEVIERGEGWLLREIQFDGRTVRERITFEPERRVHFEQVSGASGWIDNLIEEAPDGSLRLRFVFGVPGDDVERVRAIEPVYRRAVASTLATVRRLVAEGKMARGGGATLDEHATQPERNKRLVREVLEHVFNAHDLDAADRYYPVDYIQHNPNVEPGLEGFKKFFGALLEAIPDWKAEAEHVLAEGDRVVTVINWSGTLRKDFMGIPANGQRVELRTADVFRVEGGLIREHWDVVDRLLMLESLGVAPGPAKL